MYAWGLKYSSSGGGKTIVFPNLASKNDSFWNTGFPRSSTPVDWKPWPSTRASARVLEARSEVEERITVAGSP